MVALWCDDLRWLDQAAIAAFAGASFARASQDSLRRATGMCKRPVSAIEVRTRSAV
jgi:hypothetical protein